MNTGVKISCRALLIVAGLVLTSSVASAVPRPLPDFEVKGVDGRVLRSADLAQGGRWLLIYFEAGCQPCESLLKVLQSDETIRTPMLNVVVVVGGRKPEEVRSLAGHFPWISQANWYADPNRQMLGALKAGATPLTAGMARGNIEWLLGGTLADPKKLESLLTSWLTRDPATTNGLLKK